MRTYRLFLIGKDCEIAEVVEFASDGKGHQQAFRFAEAYPDPRPKELLDADRRLKTFRRRERRGAIGDQSGCAAER